MPLSFLKNPIRKIFILRLPSLVMHFVKSVVVGLLATTFALAKPALHFDFEGENVGFEIVGDISFERGPRPPEFPDFAKDNRGALFNGGSRLVVKDPGRRSFLDFDNGRRHYYGSLGIVRRNRRGRQRLSHRQGAHEQQGFCGQQPKLCPPLAWAGWRRLRELSFLFAA